MWSRRTTLPSSSPPEVHDPPDWIKSTGVRSSSVPSIPVLEDGCLELEVHRRSQATHIAPAPLYFQEGIKQGDRASNMRKDVNVATSTVYVNHQGHTVKVARLADPPSSVSFPEKGPALRDDSRVSGRRNLVKTGPQTKHVNKPADYNVMKKHENGTVSANHRMKSTQSFSLHEHTSDKSASYGKVLKKSGSTNLQSPRNGKSSENAWKVLKFSDVEHQSQKTDIHADDFNGKDTHRLSGMRDPSLIKGELERGLRNITADLAALKVFHHSSKGIDNELGKKGIDNELGKTDNKRSLPVEPTSEDFEESKENNFPCKRSRGSLSEHDHGGTVEIINSFKNSVQNKTLNESSSSMKYSQESGISDSKHCSTYSMNLNNRRKSLSADNMKGCMRHEKIKSYDPEKARGYIRRQKKERLNRLKAEQERQTADIDARKQKLSELSRMSLKLVKASIKPKSTEPVGAMGKMQRDKNKVQSKSLEVHSNGDSSSVNPIKKQLFSDHSSDGSISIARGLDSPGVIASPDVSNTQLIRDICDMKTKIEAMAKVLKSAVVTNHGRLSCTSDKVEKKDGQQHPVFMDLKEQTVQQHAKSPPSQRRPTDCVENNMDSSIVSEILQPGSQSPYLHSLTSNLRKMRESLQIVLNQSEIQPSGESLDPKSIPDIDVSLRNPRFSSAESEPAFSSIFDGMCKASSLDGSLSTKVHKRKITTSFPTLPLASSNFMASDHSQPLRSTSEADIRGKASDILHGLADCVEDKRKHDNHDDFNSSKSLGGLNPSNSLMEDLPVWCEKFTKKPYPINIMSAVKCKLSGRSMETVPMESRPSASSHSSVPVTQTSSSNQGASISKIPTNLPKWERQSSIPPSITVRTTDCLPLNPPIIISTSACSDHGNASSANSRYERLSSEVPVSVPTRVAPNTSNNAATWSTVSPSLMPPNISSTAAIRRETFSSFNQLRNSEEEDKPDNKSFLREKCSILDALNLEKMNADFQKALNFPFSQQGEVVPAEKPLSAPSTPAKSTEKIKRGRSVQVDSNSRPRVSKPNDNEGNTSPFLSEEPSGSVGNEILNDPEADTVSTETTSLVPPNVTLRTSRVERDAHSVASCASHPQESRDQTSKENPEGSNVQKNPTFRDTFEIGHVFNPTALHLQFQAELNILDSFNESLCQVMEIEKVRAVAMARHDALLEQVEDSIHKEDKSVDVQRSLVKSTPEIPSINYIRGSGDLSEVTMLDNCSSSLGMIDSEHLPEDNLHSSVKEELSSPSSIIASDSVSSLPLQKPEDAVVGHLSSESTAVSRAGKQSPSSVRSISEEIYTVSEAITEARSQPSVVSTDKSMDARNKSKSKMVGGAHEFPIRSTSTHDSNRLKKPGENFSFDVTVNSFNPDTTLAGNNSLVIESLSRSECHIFPPQASGEDMLQFTLQMLEQLMHEEELRVLHKNTLLKLRIKVLGDMARAEVASLDLDKKKLREKGEEGHKDQISALRKKQRGIMLRFQQQREEIERLRRTDELAWQERRLMYLQQINLIRMQVSTRVMLQKFEKSGGTLPKKSRVVVRSIHESRGNRTAHKLLAGELHTAPPETAVGLALSHSSSVSLASLVSDASRSSVLSNVSRRVAGAGDSESSHLEDRVLKGLNELESRSRELKCREKALHERRQSVEQIIQWRRMLEEEERRLKDVERQAHGRQRSSLSKHVLRDRSTSPFQFPDSGVPNGSGNGCSTNSGRSIADLVRSVSASVTEEVDSSIPEEVTESISKPSADSTPNVTNTDQYVNESFESELSEVKTVESQLATPDTLLMAKLKEEVMQQTSKVDSDCDSRLPRMSERSNKYPGVTIKVPLSPRLQRVQRRRYSSGSDDSMVLSQTETGSEQSDIEGRISALTEQLEQCKAEAERLRREAKRTRNERLLAKEQSLQKQLQAYETYICQLRTNLDAELKQSSVPIVRPQIKQPRVARGKVASRRAASQTDAVCVRKDDPEFEAVAIASEAASEATSEAASEVHSDGASEVSENSNDAPSLVANQAFTKDLAPVSNQEEGTIEALSDASETGSEILSAITTEEVPDDVASVLSVSKDVSDSHENNESNYSLEEQVSHDASAQATDVRMEDTPWAEPGKSLTSEDEPEDVSEILEDDQEALESEGGSGTDFIRVFVKEKEKEFGEQIAIPMQTVEELKPQLAVQHVLRNREELVDRITNEIFEGLMSTSLSEAADDIISIHKRKLKPVVTARSEPDAGVSRTQDVRKRVSEILAETQSPNVLRAKGRVREMMVTTYGVLSPDDSPCGSPNLASSPIQHLRSSSPTDEDLDTTYNKAAETSALIHGVGTVCKTNNSTALTGDCVADSEGVSQEWFDEDFGLTRSRREAEELRRQQMILEEQIQQLQQQQAQEHIPYYYVREIPNKPPPPYTPPGQAPRLLSSSGPVTPPVEEVHAVCSDRPTILKCVASAVDLLYDARLEGKDVSDMDAPSSYLEAGFDLPQPPHHLSEQELAIYKNSAEAYRMFLFDLAKQLVTNAYSCEQDDPNPPWLRPDNWVRRRKALAVVPKSRDMLHETVSKQVLVLFGFVPKASKENLTIRWSRKKRDQVDELLVRESQEEERQWTNYEQDEAVVKNNVTLAILDSLLDDTVRVLSDVFRKREQRQQCSVY